MVAFPNCKINLGLNIIRKRKDIYHDLETVFYPLSFTDILEILPAQTNQNEFSITGSALSNSEDNLCLKAYWLLKKDFPELPFIQMHLHKVIPMGAGLGGGSANGAFTLMLLNKKFSLNLQDEKLKEYALQLGSDCPFFIVNKPSFAAGLGEMLQPAYPDLKEFKILLVCSKIHIDTTWAYSQITPTIPTRPIHEIIKQPVENWKEELVNDFEIPVFKNYPELQKLKQDLYNMGAVYASLTGSGSAIYGLFKKNVSISLPGNDNFFYKIIDSGNYE